MNRLNEARTVALRLDPIRTLRAQKNLDRLDAYRAKVAAQTIHPLDNAALEELPALLAGFEIEYHEFGGATMTQADLEAADRARARLKFSRVPELERVERRHKFPPNGTVRTLTGSILIFAAFDPRAEIDMLARGAMVCAGLALLIFVYLEHRRAARRAVR